MRNAKSNTIYAYLNESVWDPAKKKCVCKRKCIGHVDPITGNIVPNKTSKPKENPQVKSRYVCKLFDKVSEEIGLAEVMALCFPDYWKKMSTLAYYVAATGDEMYFCRHWSENHKTPSNVSMTPETMNDILKNITSNSISLFFTLWRLRVQPADVYVSTLYVKGYYIDLEEYSRNLDIDIDEKSHKTKIELYFASKNEVPLCYSITSPTSNRRVGDYDVSRNSFSKITSFVDETEGDPVDASLIAYAKSNIIARVRPDNEFVKSLTEKVSKTITDEENYRMIQGTPLFIETFMNHYKGRRYYVHICYDSNQSASDLSTFISVIKTCRYEVESGNPVPEHQHIYDKYLMVREEDRCVVAEYNSQAILEHNNNAGYSVYISNYTRNPASAIVPFLQKKTMTRTFDRMVNEYDNYTLNLSTETFYLSRIFIQFLALILKNEVEHRMDASKLNKVMSFKEMVEMIDDIKTIKIPGTKKPLETEIDDIRRRILDIFDVRTETDRGLRRMTQAEEVDPTVWAAGQGSAALLALTAIL
ncbi:MAG: hypothetical protein IKQ60_00725 [Candidatus Methanomethylophilaceae archaeon]|nr:hypothetical protein [Candidatus Methanomethylophilaceae archaeon]